MIEHHFTCPVCWSTISVLVDTSIPRQTYVEDCEVCCNPIVLDIECDHDEILMFSAEVDQ